MQKTIDRTAGDAVVHRLQADGNATITAWRLTYYLPNTRLKPHCHDQVHFSVLLAGQARESTLSGEFSSRPFLMEIKPADFSHANQFGPDGALLLSVTINPDNPVSKEFLPVHAWRTKPGGHLRNQWRQLARKMLAPTDLDQCDLDTLTFDLLSSFADAGQSSGRRNAPPWLKRAREAVLETDDSVQSIAAYVGVHRVHLARCFQRYFGYSITQCRQEARLAQVVRLLMVGDDSVRNASFDAGFSDQPHLTRVMGREIGVTPKVLRSAFLR